MIFSLIFLKVVTLFKYQNQCRPVKEWGCSILSNKHDPFIAQESPCNLVIFVSLGYWFSCPSDLFYEHGESFNMHRRTEEEADTQRGLKTMALILLWAPSTEEGEPGAQIATQIWVGGRSVVFWMHYHIGSRASEQPSVQWLARIGASACARHHYLGAGSDGRRMGWQEGLFAPTQISHPIRRAILHLG